jgi:uncharacterized membrane protein YhhN
MTSTAWVLLAVAGALAVGDWIAVSPGVAARRAEFALKPAAMVALIGVALALTPEHDAQRALFVTGLALSLAGDVFLMLPSDLFVAGLASFLLAHLAYIAGFAAAGITVGWAAAGAAVVVIAGATIGRKIVRAVRAGEHRSMVAPVAAYMTVISAMVVLAIGSADGVAAAGALLFYCSDALIAWDRFVSSKRWARPAIMATYHLAQGALVVSLAR